jgi:serine phosphatase RsbU (regulator of sigma subunit)
MYALMESLATALEPSALIERVLEHLLEVFEAADVVGHYLAEDPEAWQAPRLALKRGVGVTICAALGDKLIDKVVGQGLAVVSAPVDSVASKRGRGSILHAPMRYHDAVTGVLFVRAAEGGGVPFEQPELDQLVGIALQTAMALKNADLHQELLAQHRLQQDLVLAEQIQKSFLPRTLPEAPGIRFVTEYRPAYSVGGDFYDIFWIAPRKVGIFVGDVSGKGVSAALLMARISSDMRLVAMSGIDPGSVMEHVNRALLERAQDDIFVTAIYLTLDIDSREILLTNAGHLPPVVRRKLPGLLHRIEGGEGTAIGITADADYPQVKLVLEPGDSLVLCTDGVLEATSAATEQFGFGRLEQSLAAGDSRADAISERLMADLRAHVWEAPQYDDLTLVICGIE